MPSTRAWSCRHPGDTLAPHRRPHVAGAGCLPTLSLRARPQITLVVPQWATSGALRTVYWQESVEFCDQDAKPLCFNRMCISGSQGSLSCNHQGNVAPHVVCVQSKLNSPISNLSRCSKVVCQMVFVLLWQQSQQSKLQGLQLPTITLCHSHNLVAAAQSEAALPEEELQAKMHAPQNCMGPPYQACQATGSQCLTRSLGAKTRHPVAPLDKQSRTSSAINFLPIPCLCTLHWTLKGASHSTTIVPSMQPTPLI